MSPEGGPVPRSLRPAAGPVPSSATGEKKKRLNGAEAALMTVVFAAAVVLHLTGSTRGEVVRLVGTTGVLAALIVASASGRIPVRAWIRRLATLAGDE